jgi:hypothetical protein
VPSDDNAVLPSRQHGLDEAELADAPFEGGQLLLADPPRVRRVRTELVNRDLLDGEHVLGAHADRT